MATQAMQGVNTTTRQAAWVGLTLLPGWGPVRVWREVGNPPNPEAAWNRKKNDEQEFAAREALLKATACNAEIITWDDATYPSNLRVTENPPPVLFVQGTLIPQDSAAIAIVGSRRASAQATQLSFILARDLAACGVTVVSGLASGVDAAAHRGAIAANGRTIAVVASGVDHVYPPNHKGLAKSITEHGAMLSQFPCGSTPVRSHFPIRNRTMAGLALATVVVEAPIRSGALITARFALEMGREVMACPGDVLREHTHGSNALIRDGARLVQSAGDILEEIAGPLRRILATLKHESTPQTNQGASLLALPFSGLSAPDDNMPAYPGPPVHTEVWKTLLRQPGSADSIVNRTGLSSAEIRSALTELEMLGYVKRGPGDLYTVASSS